MKKTKSKVAKKSSSKSVKPKKAGKKKGISASAKKPKLKKDWQEDPELEEDDKREEDDSSFADEQEPKLENLDDALLDTGDDEDEDEDFHNEDSAF